MATQLTRNERQLLRFCCFNIHGRWVAGGIHVADIHASVYEIVTKLGIVDDKLGKLYH